MNVKGFLINERTDGLIPVAVEMVMAKNMLLVRLPGQNVTISLRMEDVKKVTEGEEKP